MAITFPLLTGWVEAFTTAPARSKDVGSGSNRKAYAILGNGDTALTPSGCTVGSDTLTLVGSTLTDSGGVKWRLYAVDLTVSGTQTVTPTWSGTPTPSSGSFTSLMVIQGGAALTVDGVLALAEWTTGGGGGSASRTITTTSGDYAVLFCAKSSGGAAGTATSGTTLITSDNLSSDAGRITASGASTSPSLDFGAFYGGANFGFAVREAVAPVLTSPTSSATGKNNANAGATTDTASGTMYALARIGGSAASAATIVATGTSLAITSTGAKSVALAGLTSGSTYVADICHANSAGNSNAVTSGSFTPATIAYSGTIAAQTCVGGFSITWSGVNPSTLFSSGIGSRTFTGTGLGASGLTVNSSTGVLQGTGGTAGTYSVAIVGTDQSTAGTPNPQTISSNTFTLTVNASGDTTRPTLTGVVTISAITSTTAAATWPAGADNAAVAGYDYQVNGGTFTQLGNVLTVNLTGLTPSTAYTVNVRARDTSNNVSTPVITGGFTTNSAAAGTFTSAVLKRNNGTVVASSSLSWLAFRNASTGAHVMLKTGVSTDANGVFVVVDAALTTGTYRADWKESTGQQGYGVAAVT